MTSMPPAFRTCAPNVYQLLFRCISGPCGCGTSQARGLNAKFRSVALRFDETKRCFELDVEALAEALGPQTAALIVNTPRGRPEPELDLRNELNLRPSEQRLSKVEHMLSWIYMMRLGMTYEFLCRDPAFEDIAPIRWCSLLI